MTLPEIASLGGLLSVAILFFAGMRGVRVALAELTERLDAQEQELVRARFHAPSAATGLSDEAAADPLSNSKIARNGLAVGTKAPPLTVERLDGGGEIRLEDAFDRPLLLVFISQDCAPCAELLPELLSFSVQQPDIRVVLIAKGDRAVLTEKLKSFKSSAVLIGLQDHWEVSRAFGTFRVPSACRIASDGNASSTAWFMWARSLKDHAVTAPRLVLLRRSLW